MNENDFIKELRSMDGVQEYSPSEATIPRRYKTREEPIGDLVAFLGEADGQTIGNFLIDMLDGSRVRAATQWYLGYDIGWRQNREDTIAILNAFVSKTDRTALTNDELEKEYKKKAPRTNQD